MYLKSRIFLYFFFFGEGGSYLSLIQYPLIGMSVVIENWVEPPCLSLMRESTGFVQILLLCLNHINLWGLCTCVVKKNHCFMWLEFLSITYPIKKITSVYIIDAKFKFKSVGKMYPWIKWTFLTTANNDFTVV